MHNTFKFVIGCSSDFIIFNFFVNFTFNGHSDNEHNVFFLKMQQVKFPKQAESDFICVFFIPRISIKIVSVDIIKSLPKLL